MHAIECRDDPCTVRLREELPLDETLMKKPKWHVSCRQSFTSKRNLTFVRKEVKDEELLDISSDGVHKKCMRSLVKQCFN